MYPKIAAYRLLALVCVSTGALGVFLPLLPTTPFLLLALWAASRGAPRMAESLRNHPRHGPVLRAWEQQRAIPIPARVLATAMLSASASLLFIADVEALLRIALLVLFTAVGTWIWTRPLPKKLAT